MSLTRETCGCGAEWEGGSAFKSDRDKFREAHVPCRDNNPIAAERDKPLRQIDELLGGLREAIDFADEGWGYASDYFREKWDYEGERARLLALADSLTERGER